MRDRGFWTGGSNLRGEPRRLDDRDFSAFEAATAKPPAERTLAMLQAHIRSKNPVRWARLRRDMRWVKKEMRKLGLNPEDARWILP